MDENVLSDTELDRLLAQASAPEVPTGFNDRLLLRLKDDVSVDPRNTAANVIAFSQNRKTPRWLSMLPLAASLAASLVSGIYLGAGDYVPAFLSNTSSIATANEDAMGLDDFTTLDLDGQT